MSQTKEEIAAFRPSALAASLALATQKGYFNFVFKTCLAKELYIFPINEEEK